MNFDLVREAELAIAAEAAAHAIASAELNPYCEAEVLQIGRAFAVYSGAHSSVHGVIGLGFDGPVEERELQEIERFYSRKERGPAFWACAATDPGLLDWLKTHYQKTRSERISRILLEETSLADSGGNSTPDIDAWPLAFTQTENPKAKEPNLLSLTKIHQKNTRYYVGGASASYTYFQGSVAYVPFPVDRELLLFQAREAREFKSSLFVVRGEFSYTEPFYERDLYEPV